MSIKQGILSAAAAFEQETGKKLEWIVLDDKKFIDLLCEIKRTTKNIVLHSTSHTISVDGVVCTRRVDTIHPRVPG